MVQYDASSWYGIAFQITGSVIPRLLFRIVIAVAIGGVAAWAWMIHEFKISPVAHTMIGVALGLLLVFRTNASYDRYWEGRKLFGSMVNRTRDLLRQTAAFVASDERGQIRRLTHAWYIAVVQSLRSETELAPYEALLNERERDALKNVTNRAPVLAAWISARLTALARAGELSEQRLMLMDANLTALIDALGACERIRRTPIPFAYAQHIKVFVLFFCFTAPFTMAEQMHWYTPIAAGLLAFALFGIDEIGVEIEDPFGRDANDLPLDAIEKTIARSMDETLATPQPDEAG
jgi:putative membrane protein